MGPQPDFADALQAKLPPILKWCFAGMGAMAGWYYAGTDATPIPLSYIALGAAAGFCLLGAVFMAMRLFKTLAILGVFFLALNYVVLIPFGFGDYLSTWLNAGRTVIRLLDPAPLAHRWGNSPQTPVRGR